MGYGDLVFRRKTTSVTRDEIANVLAAALGAPVETEETELEGNPYDTYFGSTWIRGQHPTAPTSLGYTDDADAPH